MCILSDLTGKTFDRLTVIEYVGNSMWKCMCSCGKEKNIAGVSLRSGRTKSCGCFNAEILSRRMSVHGLRSHVLNRIWRGMIQRCTNKNNPAYKNYGGRSINICEEWRSDFKKFYDWAMENGWTEDLSIDRIDNEKGYSPNNCRWADKKEQANNRRSNVLITHNGETHTIMQWSKIVGINYTTLHNRLKILGWDVRRALIS